MDLTKEENVSIVDLSQSELGELSAFLKSWDVYKITWLGVQIFCQTIGNVMLASVIWFDEYGCCDRYKTILNHLASHLSIVLIGMDGIIAKINALLDKIIDRGIFDNGQCKRIHDNG